MFALIQSENHASNKGKTAGRYQFDTHPTRIGLNGPIYNPKKGGNLICLLEILTWSEKLSPPWDKHFVLLDD